MAQHDSQTKGEALKVPRSYASWTLADLEAAAAAVRTQGPGHLSMRAAERVYSVPARTIKRYIDGKDVGVAPGRSSALSEVEEDGLVQGLLDRARRGYPATRFNLKTMVLDVISDGRPTQFGERGPSDKWVSQFLQRHSDVLTVRKARILDSLRVNAADKHEIEYFFEEYIDFLKKYSPSPAQIYNCDETGIDTQGGTPKKVISKKGAKMVAVRRGPDRENTTCLLAVSATGAWIPPLFVFKGVEFPSDFMEGSPNGSVGTVTSSAFIDSDSFGDWIDHFVNHIPPTRPVLLILDNHASHVGLTVRRKCIANGVHLLSFPPHTTHILQPLDAGCFRSFKSTWRDKIATWAETYQGQSLAKHCRSEVIGDALMEAFTPKNITGSWKSTGMWPVDLKKPLATIGKICTKDTTLEATYSRFIAIRDPLPLREIETRSLTRLKDNGIDISGFRTYSIVMRDLLPTATIKRRSPTKTLIKLGAKRLLTHEDCMAEEEKKERAKKEAAESSLMRAEDSLSKKVEIEARKLLKASVREQKRAEVAERKRIAALEKEAKRRAREMNAVLSTKKPSKRTKRQSGPITQAEAVTLAQEHAIPSEIGTISNSQAVHVCSDSDIVAFVNV